MAETQVAHEEARTAYQAIEGELDELGEVMDRALAPAVIKTAPVQQPPGLGLPPSVRSTLEAFPRDGDTNLADLRAKFGLSTGAVNTRVAKAKQGGFIESTGWGRYGLTDKGKQAIMGLRVVPPEN